MFLRELYIVLIVLCLPKIIYSQEIINCKIETKSPPTYFNQANLSNSFKPINSARVDLFDEFGSAKIGIPKNYAGNQEPDGDQNYLGIITYFGKGTITLKETIDFGLSNSQYTDNYSSYIQLEIPSKLNPENEYDISFKVSLSDNSEYATSGFGIYLSNKQYVAENNMRLKIQPQISFTDTVKDKLKWVELKAKYKPKGDEKYILIGCFDKNYATYKVDGSKGFGLNKAYYYVSSVKFTEIPKDMDKDGVIDKEDLCIDVFGLKELKGCPDKDSDGIADKDDKCPDFAGPSKFNGCPDTDNDGIPDVSDKCPTVSGLAVNNGCPEVVAEVYTIESVKGMLTSLKFDAGKDNISPESLAIIDKVAALLKENPTWEIVIDGVSSSENLDVKKDKVLLDKRMNSVKSYLIKTGCNSDLLKSIDYGVGKGKKGKTGDRRIEY